MNNKTSQIKEAGLKITRPRVKILSILENSDKRHMSAEDVYKVLLSEDEDIGLATVYRVLTQFESSGIVVRHHFDSGQSVFELDNGDAHSHLLCIKCGQIVEFIDDEIDHQANEIADRNGYEIKDRTFVIYGLCGTCRT